MSLKQYEVILTTDGSPSLVEPTHGEAMHNRKGALEESLLIYHSTLAKCGQETGNIKAFSVGLGLGYNELLFLAELFKTEVTGSILSCEADEELVESWIKWLSEQQSPLAEHYETSLKLVCQSFDFSQVKFKNFVHKSHDKELLQTMGSLDLETIPKEKFNCILFDPFSAKTNPNLWSPEFLDQMLSQLAVDQCYFSTYAAKGDLTRALKKHGFKVDLLEGYGGKRQRTYAEKIT